MRIFSPGGRSLPSTVDQWRRNREIYFRPLLAEDPAFLSGEILSGDRSSKTVKPIMREQFRSWAVFVAGALVAGLIAWVHGWFISSLSHNFESWRVISAELLLKIVIPATGGVVALWLDRRPRRPEQQGPHRRRLRAGLALTVALGYFVTWFAGVPSVITRLTSEEIQQYKLLETPDHDFSRLQFPTIKTLVALPVLPGVVAVYHEAHLSGQNGWGGWVFYAWWGAGSKHLGTAVRWVS